MITKLTLSRPSSDHSKQKHLKKFKKLYHDLNNGNRGAKTKMKPFALLLLATVVSLSAITGVAFAAEEGAATSTDAGGSKLLGAGLAFGLAACGAGIGLGIVASAGLAVISENPAFQSKVFIFVGMVESIAIYGIVMMFIILGQ
jgi:V/A-type H+-transporting ATPase subunit K